MGCSTIHQDSEDPILTEVNLMIVDENLDVQAEGDPHKQFELLKPVFEQHINNALRTPSG